MTERSEKGAKPGAPFFVRLIATGCFSGYSPVASGTAGSLVALAVFALPIMRSQGALAAAVILSLTVGAYVSGIMERWHGDDPSIVVIDEIAGMWISLMLLPQSPAITAIAFILFRLFDIIKPPPARRLERIKGGWGIMLDDVAAGLYANIALRVLLVAIPGLSS